MKSSYQGVPRSELEKIKWNFYDHPKSKDDERREDVLDRFRKQLKLTLRRHPGEQVVWASHGDPIILMTLWAEGKPLEEIKNRKGKRYIGNGSVTKIAFDTESGLPIRVELFEPNKKRIK